uniref:THAP domain-containing protein 1 n=1 Tax=Xiphophorus couchianus TaxID=32473 RepID=A0A3B5MDN8_9TELE
MVCSCAFPGCANRANSWSPYRFHRIPLADLHLRMLWLSVLGMDVNTPPAALKHLRSLPKKIVVCANHFTTDCFENYRQYTAGFALRLRLKKGSVPTIRFKFEDDGDVSTA